MTNNQSRYLSKWISLAKEWMRTLVKAFSTINRPNIALNWNTAFLHEMKISPQLWMNEDLEARTPEVDGEHEVIIPDGGKDEGKYLHLELVDLTNKLSRVGLTTGPQPSVALSTGNNLLKNPRVCFSTISRATFSPIIPTSWHKARVLWKRNSYEGNSTGQQVNSGDR